MFDAHVALTPTGKPLAPLTPEFEIPVAPVVACVIGVNNAVLIHKVGELDAAEAVFWEQEDIVFGHDPEVIKVIGEGVKLGFAVFNLVMFERTEEIEGLPELSIENDPELLQPIFISLELFAVVKDVCAGGSVPSVFI